MEEILKQYGLKDTTDYWELIEESFVNGQRQQAHDYFTEMPQYYRKAFVKAVLSKDFDSDYSFKNICGLVDLI